MINARKLMPNNLIYKDLNVMYVNNINLYGDHGKPTINGWDEEDFEPIELTPEWLIKLGFERLFSLRWHHPEGVDIEKIKNSGYHLLCEDQSNWSRGYKYVHEVQNLFEILTGEELIIKTS